jgi:uncharacterized protein YbaP (TraB family)
MLSQLFRVLLLLLFSGFFCNPVSVQAADKNEVRGFLWEVGSGKGRVLLMGSVHLLNADHYPLPAKLEKA